MGVWGLISNKVKNMYYTNFKTKINNKSNRLQVEANRLLRDPSKKNRKNKIRKQRKYNSRVPRKYNVYIKSVYWEKRKNKYWQNFQKKCAVCGSFSHVQLHHIKYGWTHFGKEPDTWLVPMCQFHHNDFHEQQKMKSDMTTETLDYINDNYIPHDSTDV